MIRARLGTDDGSRQIFLVGLTGREIKRLRTGDSITIDLARMGGPHGSEMLIVSGETEDDIVRDLQNSGVEIPSLPFTPAS